MTQLSVNLNKIALLRNARGRDFPNVVEFGARALESGADGLTIHPRPDQRHAKYSDIATLKSLCKAHGAELNVEGYPSAELVNLCVENRVDQMTLVPDLPNQITSDHGWSLLESANTLKPVIERLKTAGIRVSLFMDTDIGDISRVADTGADRIELHTEPYARAYENQVAQDVIIDYVTASDVARGHGIEVNAGHDLTLDNLSFFLNEVEVEEVSIGHALTVESLELGWDKVVTRYAEICQSSSR